MKKRVHYQEDIKESIERIPFLKRFLYTGLYDNKGVQLWAMIMNNPFDYIKMNEYMRNISPFPIDKNRSFGSADINCILEEAEKRRDL